MATIDAWHFLPHDQRLRKPLPDGSRPLVTPGWTYRTENTIEMFWRGLDANERPIDALRHGSGPVACRVRLSGAIHETTTLHRLCATHFTVLWIADVLDLLDRFGILVAERTLLRERRAGREPDSTLWKQLAHRRALIDDRNAKHQLDPSEEQRLREAVRERWRVAIAARDALPRSEQMEWGAFCTAVDNALVATLPGAVGMTISCSGPSYTLLRQRKSSHISLLLKYAETAATLSKAAWSQADEAAAVAAGLAVQPDELNAELEQLLLTAKPDGDVPA